MGLSVKARSPEGGFIFTLSAKQGTASGRREPPGAVGGITC